MKKRIFIICFILIILLGTILFLLYNRGDEISAVNLYKNLIDEAVKNNSYGNEMYISIYIDELKDPLNGTILSDNSKLQIINHCRSYNDIIYTKTVQQIIDENIGNQDDLNGLVININLLKISNKNITLNLNCYRSNIGNSGKQYNCIYEDDCWKISNIGVIWSS